MTFFDLRVPASCRRPLWLGLLLCTAGLATSPALAAAPADDLTTSFSSQSVAGEAGNIVGTVTNRSRWRYPCVDLVFSLSSHFDDRNKGLPVVSYGTQTIRVQDIDPGTTARFVAPLPRKAGIGFLRYETCSEPVSDASPPSPPSPPVPPLTEDAKVCKVSGSIASETGFEGVDDRRQREVIERVYVLDAADRRLVAEVRLGQAETRVTDRRTGRSYSKRSYTISGLSAKRRYIVRLSNAWRTEPTELVFDCPDRRARHTFQLPVLRHTGNRLGG
ncbi:MAG: hypothetical protein H6942_13885 [Candidatus Accumulibacter sp.]|uniref:hypothetical protein n=1 Tax=Accumulibacter sp. TaxID=2053492 RepID=UPI001D49512F|nr:hypothetical protein [Accumulibacter sp.]MCB1943132.1 hypothetical protein [Accumulibacter sp.]MCP5249602.1 hypothetical protein [Accumulibacter sp.]